MAPKRSRLAQRRKAVGHTQESLAHILSVDRTTVVRWERGDCEPQPWVRRSLAAALDVSLDHLAAMLVPAQPSRALDNSPSCATTVGSGTDEGDDPMDRRRFTAVTALAGLGLAGPLRDTFLSQQAPRYLGLEQVQWASSLLENFRRIDSINGASSLCDLAMTVRRRLLFWARDSSYSAEVGTALQSALAQVAGEIGWLTIDAERRPEARHHLHEAISRARLADDPRAEVQALACLSLLTREAEPRESRHCAEAAQRASAGWATPRLRALLHLRAAHASAHQQDPTGFVKELARAKTELDKGTHDDDLPFLQFVTPQEATSLEGLSYLALGRPDRAVECFRKVVGDPELPRNAVHQRINLADAQRQVGDVSEAGRVALAVLPSVVALESPRVARRMQQFRSDIGQHTQPDAAAFAAAYDRRFAA